MSQLILHKDGAYNFYSTITDAAGYESALSLEQLHELIKLESGESGLNALPERLERAHKTGCSSHPAQTLEECISCNRSGPDEKHMSDGDFIAKYLTLPTSLPTNNSSEKMQCDIEAEQIATLKSDASAKLREAEKAWYALACELPVGRDRERAFEVYENVRTATRIGA